MKKDQHFSKGDQIFSCGEVERPRWDPYNKRGSDGFNVRIVYEHGLARGEGTTFNDECWLNARWGITIGENTLFGPRVFIHSGNHVLKPFDIVQNVSCENSWEEKEGKKRVVGDPVTIGSDCWIGAGCIILAGSIIPDKCVIGAGTIITKSNSKRLKRGDIVVSDVPLKILGNRKDIKE